MNPVLVEVFRKDTVESIHRGAVVAINVEGNTVLELGDVNALVFPRSSLKPLQAIPLAESGALEHFDISDRELALACASHSGEEQHRQVLNGWMQRVGLTPAELECGPSLPMDKTAAELWLRDGGEAAKELHNCSGKHTGMLTLAAFQGHSLAGYSEYDHPTQQGWLSLLSELSGVNAADMPWDKDGCGLPTVALPLIAFARSFIPFMGAADSHTKRDAAMTRITTAMRSHPEMVAGTNRCCTASMANIDGLIVKVGAEGVFVAVAIDAGIAIALKADDGAGRAAEVMLGAALRRLGLLSDAQYRNLADWYSPPVVNSQNSVVGAIRASRVWSDQAIAN